VGQVQHLIGLGQARNDLASGHIEVRNGIVGTLDVGAEAPGLTASGVDDLHPIAAGRAQPPGYVSSELADVLVAHALHNLPVVAEESESPFVQNGNLLQLLVGMARSMMGVAPRRLWCSPCGHSGSLWHSSWERCSPSKACRRLSAAQCPIGASSGLMILPVFTFVPAM